MTSFNFDFDDIRRQFFDFMLSLGIQPHDENDIKFDGELHRYRIHDDKKGHTSGAYLVHIDGWPAGYVQDWRTDIKENWRYQPSNLSDEQHSYFNSEEFKKKTDEEHRKAEEFRRKEREKRSEAAQKLFDRLEQAPEDFPYFLRKGIKPYSIALNPETNCLAVPLRDISGRLLSIQWINQDGQKRFFEGAELKGAFFSIDLFSIDKDYAGVILLGEGPATMLKVYNLSGYPAVAAMSCHRLEEIAGIIHNNFPDAKIIITADNDHKTEKKRGKNPGLFYAQGVVKKNLAVDVIYPEFQEDEHGSDWDDFAILHGDNETADILRSDIQKAMIPQGIKQMLAEDRLQTVNAQSLRFKHFEPIKWVVPGVIPSGLSILGGGPKTGKSIFVLDIGVAVAIGGYVFSKIQVEQGDALYLALEDNQRRLQERIDFINLDDKDDISPLTLVTRIPRQHEGGNEFIKWWLSQHPRARVVIIDTLQMFRRQLSGKGNVYAEDYQVISELKNLADAYNIAIIVLHHLKKMSSKDDSQAEISGDWINMFSGSIGLSGSADALFMLKRDRMGKLGRLYRTGRDVEECSFELVLEGLRWDFKGEVDDLLLPTWKKQIVDFLAEHSTVSPADLAAGYDLNINTAQSNLRRMEREGLIRKIGYGTYGLNPDNSK